MWHHDVLQHGCFYSNGNQYSFMQASFYIIVHNSFSMNFSIRGSSAWWSRARMVRVAALGIQVSLRYPTAMLEDSMTSVKKLYSFNSKREWLYLEPWLLIKTILHLHSVNPSSKLFPPSVSIILIQIHSVKNWTSEPLFQSRTTDSGRSTDIDVYVKTCSLALERITRML